MNILMVLTSHDRLGDTGKPTGFWLEEFAAPYYTFLDAGAHVTLASPAGGQPPLDPSSDAPAAQTDFTRRFKTDAAAQAALCHAPGVLRHVAMAGRPLVQGKRVTGFSDTEEAAVNLTTVVPFLVEQELRRLGGKFEKAADWQSFTIVDGNLITGQNPASSQAAAEQLVRMLS